MRRNEGGETSPHPAPIVYNDPRRLDPLPSTHPNMRLGFLPEAVAPRATLAAAAHVQRVDRAPCLPRDRAALQVYEGGSCMRGCTGYALRAEVNFVHTASSTSVRSERAEGHGFSSRSETC